MQPSCKIYILTKASVYKHAGYTKTGYLKSKVSNVSKLQDSLTRSVKRKTNTFIYYDISRHSQTFITEGREGFYPVKVKYKEKQRPSPGYISL